jgi:hypothetical protein
MLQCANKFNVKVEVGRETVMMSTLIDWARLKEGEKNPFEAAKAMTLETLEQDQACV